MALYMSRQPLLEVKIVWESWLRDKAGNVHGRIVRFAGDDDYLFYDLSGVLLDRDDSRENILDRAGVAQTHS